MPQLVSRLDADTCQLAPERLATVLLPVVSALPTELVVALVAGHVQATTVLFDHGEAVRASLGVLRLPLDVFVVGLNDFHHVFDFPNRIHQLFVLVAFALLGHERLDVEVLVLAQESETVVVVHNILVTLDAIQVDVEDRISVTEITKLMEALVARDKLSELFGCSDALVADWAVQILVRSERNSRDEHFVVSRLQDLLEILVV